MKDDGTVARRPLWIWIVVVFLWRIRCSLCHFKGDRSCSSGQRQRMEFSFIRDEIIVFINSSCSTPFRIHDNTIVHLFGCTRDMAGACHSCSLWFGCLECVASECIRMCRTCIRFVHKLNIFSESVNEGTENSFILFFCPFHSRIIIVIGFVSEHAQCTLKMGRVTAPRNTSLINYSSSIWYSNGDQPTLTGALNSISRHLLARNTVARNAQRIFHLSVERIEFFRTF